MPGEPQITTNPNNWRFQDNYVERLMDNAAFTSAHPDDTLVLAGPPRFTGTNPQGQDFASNLLSNWNASELFSPGYKTNTAPNVNW